MNWLREFSDRVQTQVSLAPLTWFRLGGPARFLFRPRDTDDLASFLRYATDEGVATRILGAGANVLVQDDGFDGVVVRLDTPAFKRCDHNGESITVGAGVDLMQLSKRLSQQGYTGLECMAGIPATVGGAVRMNAGGRFGEFADVVSDVTLMEPGGTVETWSRERIDFGYRRSAIGGRTVLSARLTVTPVDPLVTRARFDECFAAKRRAQPLAEHSAGCIFKNPKGTPAGALIDQAGLKGHSCGRARVSEQHANFIVADRGARASEVVSLIREIQERVRERFGTLLETEIDVW